MNVERRITRRLSQAAAALLVVAALNLPQIARAEFLPTSADIPGVTAGQNYVDNFIQTEAVLPSVINVPDYLEIASQKEVAPILLDVDVLMYHEVTANKLKSDFMDLIDRGYQPISLETFIKAQRGEIKIPEGLKTFMPTLDDSRLSQYQAIIEATEQVQKETGWFIPVNVFALTKFEDLPMSVDKIPGNTPSYNDGVHRYMTRDQLIDLIKRGHQVQPHTVNHGVLTSLTPGARNAEIYYSDLAIDLLWQMAGVKRDYRVFAYPYGKYDGAVLQAMQAMGFDAAFTTKPVTRHPSKNPLEIGRLGKT